MLITSGQRSTVISRREIASFSTIKNRNNKLSRNFEPVPYKVLQKNGNAVLIEDEEGNTKMLNASHMKKFVQPESCTETQEREEETGSSATEPAEAAELSLRADVVEHPATPTQSVSSPSPALRPTRARQPPAWMKDFVCSSA